MRLHLAGLRRALMHWEALLSLISGLLGSLFAVYCILDTEVETLRVVITVGGGNDILSMTSWMTLLFGVASTALGYFGMWQPHLMTFNKTIFATAIILVSNFIIGLIVTEQKRAVREHLHQDMSAYFQLTQLDGLLGHSENWDFIQMQMSCCGVNSHLDYLNGPKESLKIKESSKQWVPASCCVLKQRLPMPEPDNPSQCQYDASRRVEDSIFLHSRGCHIPVSNWYLHHIATISAVLFIIICLQAVIVFSLSWNGYNNTVKPNRRRVLSS